MAFSVFMLAIAEKMPETSESIPLIGKFFDIRSFCPKNSSKSCPKNAPQNKEFSIEGAVVPGLLLCSKNKAKAQKQQCPLMKSLYILWYKSLQKVNFFDHLPPSLIESKYHLLIQLDDNEHISYHTTF